MAGVGRTRGKRRAGYKVRNNINENIKSNNGEEEAKEGNALFYTLNLYNSSMKEAFFNSLVLQMEKLRLEGVRSFGLAPTQANVGFSVLTSGPCPPAAMACALSESTAAIPGVFMLPIFSFTSSEGHK